MPLGYTRQGSSRTLTLMNSDDRQPKSESKSRADSFPKSLLVGIACGVIPALLQDIVSFKRSWAYVVGVFVACLLAYFYPPRSKMGRVRFLVVTCLFCVAAYLFGRYIGAK
jgi:hypothetical protein